MDKCRVCGKLFQGIGLACPDCVEAMRMRMGITDVSEETKDMKSNVRIPKKMTKKEADSKLDTMRIVTNPATGGKMLVPDVTESEVTMDAVTGMNLADLMGKSPWGDLPPTQQKIHEIMGAMKDLLLYKNQMYGDSAINPEKIFYKGDSTSSILVRLNDKIGRVKANPDDKPRINDVCDIIGYCVLLLISMGVTREDIVKFMD